MNSLEDLRRQADEVRLLAKQNADKKKEEKEHHDQRKKEAEAFWEESKVGNLISEVRSLLRETHRLESVRFRGDEGRIRTDPDSKIELFYWDKASDGTHVDWVSAGMGSVGYDYDDYKVKTASVEALPDGDIVFKGNQVARVALAQWRTSGYSFNSEMDEILSNPGNTTYYDPSSKCGHSSGSGRDIMRPLGPPW